MDTTKNVRYAYEDLIYALDVVISKMDADEPITGRDYQQIEAVYQWISELRRDAFDAWMDYIDSLIGR